MQALQFGIPEQPRHLGPHARDVALDRHVRIAVPVHPHPVAQPDGPIHVQRPPALPLDQKRLGRPQRVMVQLDEVVADIRPIRPPPLVVILRRHHLARPVIPAQRLLARLDGFRRTVARQLLIGPHGPRHRLETPIRMRLRAIARGGMVELVDHQPILHPLHPVMAEQPPRHGNIRRPRHMRQKVGQGAIAHANVDELVHVDMRDPLRLPQHILLQRQVQRVLLRGLPLPVVIAAMLDDAHLLQPLQDRIRPVRTVVGIDQEIPHPDLAVIGDPFDDIGRLVPHAADDDGPLSIGRPILEGRAYRRFIHRTHPVVRLERAALELHRLRHQPHRFGRQGLHAGYPWHCDNRGRSLRLRLPWLLQTLHQTGSNRRRVKA